MASSSSPATPSAWGPDSLLRAYYTKVFRPEALKRLKKGTKRIHDYSSAVYRFERFVGGRPTLGGVTSELLREFLEFIRSRRCSEQRARDMAGCIKRIVRHWDENGVPPIEVLPPAEPGTLRYDTELYIAERMIDCNPESCHKTRRAVRTLRRQMGRDIPSSELSDAIASEFFRWLLDKGKPATTINYGYRATLFAVWNWLFDRGQVARPPRVKKLKEIRNPPTAWSEAQLASIFAAAERFRPGNFYGAIPCNQFWRALVLVVYETALRRASVLAIRRANIDLQSRVLFVDGATTKTRAGRYFELSPDAIAAIIEIWQPERERFFDAGVDVRLLSKHFGLLLEAAEIPPATRRGTNKFHKLRRSTATLVAARAGVEKAAELLQHSSAKVTIDHYIDPTKIRHKAGEILPSLKPR